MIPYTRVAVAAMVVALASPALIAQDREQRERELDLVRKEITVLERKLARKSDTRSALLAELRDIELAVARVSRDIRKLDTDITAQQSELEKLKRRRTGLDDQLAAHRLRLAAQLHAAYRVGQLQTLQLLLNQRNPAHVSRVLTYARYLNTARLGAINDTRETLTELHELIAAIKSVSRGLETSRRLLDREQQALAGNRKQRRQILGALDRELEQGGRAAAGTQ